MASLPVLITQEEEVDLTMEDLTIEETEEEDEIMATTAQEGPENSNFQSGPAPDLRRHEGIQILPPTLRREEEQPRHPDRVLPDCLLGGGSADKCHCETVQSRSRAVSAVGR